MRVFVTGATGHLGSAVVPELLQAGHEAVGLARSEVSAAALTAVGAAVYRGDLDGLREAASAADGVIHLAFKHDAMRAGDYAAAVAADLAAVHAFADALAGTGKPLVGDGDALQGRSGARRRRGRRDRRRSPGRRGEHDHRARRSRRPVLGRPPPAGRAQHPGQARLYPQH
jgi:uncharacterized protein YbjT (DUF2867 family)